MISKVRISLMTVIMLVLLGFGFQNQAIGQVGLNGLFCPGIPDTTGWLEIERSDPNPLLTDPTVSVGLVGTVESHLGSLVGGLDFQYVNTTDCTDDNHTCSPTIETGSQLITWWTQKDGRNTYLQVTNEGSHLSAGFEVSVHVRIYNENCLEIRDFCDAYTHDDTHEYNFGDLFANTGANIGDGNLQGVEGWLVVTAVKECGTDEEQAIEFDHFAGQLIVHDSDDYLYGTNVYARQSICFNTTETIPDAINNISNGSFQNGSDDWTQQEGTSFITQNASFEPPASIPVNPYNSPFAAFALADPGNGGGSYGGGSYTTINGVAIPTNLSGPDGDDKNVSVFESDPFNLDGDDDLSCSFNIQAYLNEQNFCSNWLAVFLVMTNPLDSTDGLIKTGNSGGVRCYQTDGTENSTIFGSSCQELFDGPDTNILFAGTNLFETRAPFRIGDQVFRDNDDGEYVIQIIASMKEFSTCDTNPLENVGALVNNIQCRGDEVIEFVCDECLTGDFNSKLDDIRPDTLAAQFNVLPENIAAGADVVLINFADDYGTFGSSPYTTIAASSSYFISIFDQDEGFQSCGAKEVCFVRLGIDDNIVLSEDFTPPITFPPVTPTPTAPPITFPPVTPTATSRGGNGDSSCAIAGNPVQLGTALANVLIPLVPVAFVFGVRAVRRRKK